MKPYPKYKPTGVEWLGEIPEHWDVKRLRFMAKINPVKSEINDIPGDTQVSFVPMDAVGEYGGLRLDQTKPLDEVSTGYTCFCEGDVVIAKITPCFENGKGAIAQGLENGIGFGTTELHVVRPSAELDRHLLFYLTISHPFRDIGSAYMYGAGGQKRVPDDFIRDFRQPIPLIDDQRAIVAFLDRETARIDVLIAKKERQIELLQKKRSAIISNAVTKGLNPNAKLKPSGIKWLGEIPEHWGTIRLKYNASINDEALPETTNPTYEFDYVDIGNVDAVKGIVTKEPQVFEKAPSRARRVVQNGDTIVSTVRTYLRAIAPIRESEAHLVVSTGFAVVRPRKMDSDYLSYALRSPYFVETVVSRSTGVSYPAINASDIGTIPIPIPPVNDQRAIAAFLDRETRRIDALTDKIEKSIDLLREYRTTLISAAVTGKIDVRVQAEAKQRKVGANPMFRRTVLAAEIVERLHKEPTFGHVKFMKVLYLCENHLGMDLEGSFTRQAAGPLDRRMLHSVESQMKKSKWYLARNDGERVTYVPLEKAGGHKKYFNNYWANYRQALDSLLALFRSLDSERCEIIATLFAVWNDLIISGARFIDNDIVCEARTNWHKAKERFTEDRLRSALDWMRKNGLIPQGQGKTTKKLVTSDNEGDL